MQSKSFEINLFLVIQISQCLVIVEANVGASRFQFMSPGIMSVISNMSILFCDF